MTGPEHYRRAEALLAGRNNGGANGARSSEEAIALAQVHATLALVAAQAEPWLGDVDDRTGNYVNAAWVEAIA